jgi:hypothetical protein
MSKKNLTPEERELLREFLVQTCHDGGRAGRKLSTLINKADAAGYENMTGAEIEEEVRYLEGKKLIEQVDKTLSPAVRRYRSTAQGYDFLEEKGLA